MRRKDGHKKEGATCGWALLQRFMLRDSENPERLQHIFGYCCQVALLSHPELPDNQSLYPGRPEIIM
jgi:hypothetical protein